MLRVFQSDAERPDERDEWPERDHPSTDGADDANPTGEHARDASFDKIEGAMREFLIPAAIFVASHVAIFALALPLYAIGQ
jgi:hypothetical protein